MKLVSFGEGRLIKYCRPEHNISRGANTVRLGTLYEFRDTDDEKLRDEGEGKFVFKVKFPEMLEVSNSWLDAIQLNGPGGSVSIEGMHIDGGRISISGLELSGSTANSWVYCMSMGQSNVAGGISENYSSAWEISQVDLSNFAGNLSDLLRQNVTLADLPSDIVEAYSISEIEKNLSILVEGDPVQYDLREVTVTSPDQLSEADLLKVFSKVSFIKPSYFQPEQEYRLVFKLYFKGRQISIPNNPKIINFIPFARDIRPHELTARLEASLPTQSLSHSELP